jgi:hypothetical protein
MFEARSVDIASPRVFAGTLAPLIAAMLVAAGAADDGPKSDAELSSWVNRRVEAWQPTAEERRFDQIAWAKDIRDAERLAREHDRPVFLFTHDGRINIGRC